MNIKIKDQRLVKQKKLSMRDYLSNENPNYLQKNVSPIICRYHIKYRINKIYKQKLPSILKDKDKISKFCKSLFF